MDLQPRRAHYFAKQSIVGYTLLISLLFCSAFSSKFFSTLCIEKHSWKTIFNLYPTSFFWLLHFIFLLFFVLMSPQKDNYLSLLILESFNLFAGVFRKSFLPLTIIGKLQAVCRGISRKFYKKFLLNQGHENRKVDGIIKNFIFSPITFSVKIIPLYSQGHEILFCNQFIRILMNVAKNPCDFSCLK